MLPLGRQYYTVGDYVGFSGRTDLQVFFPTADSAA